MSNLLDLENSFEAIKSLNLTSYLVLPFNSDLKNFKEKIERVSFPCWIKINSSEHKLDLNGVKKANNFEELNKIHEELSKKFKNKKLVIQKNISGVEVLAGIKTDNTFGKILVIGAGGNLTEILNDTEFIVLPCSKEEIEKAISKLKIFQILKKKKSNILSLINQLYELSKIEEIEEADLNPIIVNEKSAYVVDARVQIN